MTPARRVAALVALLALATALGCTEKLKTTEPPVNPQPVYELVTPDSVQAIFSAHCAKCHGGTDPLAQQNLSTARLSWLDIVNVVSIEDSAYYRIEPGNVADSYLLMKLRSDPRIQKSPMPLGDPPLTAATQQVISNWVAQGALPDSVEVPAAVAARLR